MSLTRIYIETIDFKHPQAEKRGFRRVDYGKFDVSETIASSLDKAGAIVTGDNGNERLVVAVRLFVDNTSDRMGLLVDVAQLDVAIEIHKWCRHHFKYVNETPLKKLVDYNCRPSEYEAWAREHEVWSPL